MKKISRQEADYLRNNKMGRYVIHGHGSYHTYLLCEEGWVVKKLDQHIKDITVNTTK